jgi:general secretion pathway protein K
MNSKRPSANLCNGARRESGAALIVALLVVAMVVMLATALSSDFLLMFRRVENQLYSEQAYAYMRGAEALSRAALLADLQKDGSKPNDNLAEEWAQPQQYPTDYGWIGGQIEDLQGRFNLNSLGEEKKDLPPGSYSKSQSQFIRLLLTLKLEEPLGIDQAQALTDSITDWIDGGDEVSGLGGAESQFYESADPPGRPANTPLVGPSELMMVKGMTPEIYRLLAPLVTVWPSSTATIKLNLNTAPIEVLRSLGGPQDLQPLSDGEIESLLDARKPPKYIEDATTISTGVLKGKQIETPIGVTSDYFLLTTITEFQGHRYSMHSILHRKNGGDKKKSVDVVARSFGDW